MALYSIDRPGGQGSRWDAEYFANEHRPFLDRLFDKWSAWRPLEAGVASMSSGHTPRGQNLDLGDGRLITLECVGDLSLDRSRFRQILPLHVSGELARARVQEGDVVVTIKRRLLNTALVHRIDHATAVNQDVVVLRPGPSYLPGFLAALLASRIGKGQALREQTEQINPYLSVSSLRRLRLPVVEQEDQVDIDHLVRARLQKLDDADRAVREATRELSDTLQVKSGSGPEEPTATVARSSEATAAQRWDAEFFSLAKGAPQTTLPSKPLGDYALTRAIANGQTPAATEYSDVGLPIVKVGGISHFGTAEWGGQRVAFGTGAARADRGRVQSGDILMVAAAHHVRYIGKSGVLRDIPGEGTEWRSVGELITIRPAPGVSPAALVTYLNLPSVQAQVQRLVRGQSAHLYPRDLRTLSVPMLPRLLQERLTYLHDYASTKRGEALELGQQAIERVEGLILTDA